MRNTAKTGPCLEDLMNHLFASAETQGNPDHNEEKLKEEVERSKVLVATAKTSIECAMLSLDGRNSWQSTAAA